MSDELVKINWMSKRLPDNCVIEFRASDGKYFKLAHCKFMSPISEIHRLVYLTEDMLTYTTLEKYGNHVGPNMYFFLEVEFGKFVSWIDPKTYSDYIASLGF